MNQHVTTTARHHHHHAASPPLNPTPHPSLTALPLPLPHLSLSITTTPIPLLNKSNTTHRTASACPSLCPSPLSPRLGVNSPDAASTLGRTESFETAISGSLGA